ncbi:MAG: hypothetical protein JJU37_04330 [Balneolaceae bacterium]|nr:hypothetical protein [Balneolaceae bacterium]
MNTKQKAAFAYIVIFLVGLAAGLLVSNHFSPVSANGGTEFTEEQTGSDRFGWQRERGERPVRGSLGNYLSRRLDLEADQRDLFMEHLEGYHADIRQTIYQQRETEGEIIREKYQIFRKGIADILSDEQLRQLDAMVHPDSVRSSGFQRMRGSGRPGR